MADGYGIGRLEDYIDSIRDNGAVFEIQNLSKEVQEILRDLTKLIDQTVKGDIPTQQELKELQKAFYSYIQSSQTTTKETRSYIAQMFTQLFIRLDKLDKNRLMHSFNANLSNMVKSGILNVNKESAEKNLLAQLLRVGYVSPLIKKVETFQDKLMTFLNIEKSQEKTKRRQFTEDLVEGLSRSKFFGGALTDLIRLGTLFVASWLKDKGTLGKVLAVALVAAGPVIGAALAGAITKGIASFFTRFLPLVIFGPIKWLGQQLGVWFTKIISTIWRANLTGARQFSGATRVSGTKAAPSIVTRESPILTSTGRNFIVDAQTGLPVSRATLKTTTSLGKGAKALAFGKGLVGGVGGVLGGLALDYLGHTAVEHGVDPRLAHGLSGAGQGAITGAMIGSVVPVIGTAVGAAIGGVVGGLTGLIKGHYEKQEELQEDSLNELKKKNDGNFWGGLSDSINDTLDEHPVIDSIMGWMSGWSSFGLGTLAYNKARNTSNAEAIVAGGEASYGSLKVGKYGEVLNPRELTQSQLSRYISAYQKADPERFNRIYEIVPEGFASMIDFQNDATAIGVNGKRGALLYKGATQDLTDLRNYLISQGMAPEKANKLMYTSGMATKTSRHAIGGVHDDPLGLGFDLVGKGWSQQDMIFADKFIKAFYEAGSGKANYEILKNGKARFTTPHEGTNNAHWDVRRAKKMTLTPDLSKNYEEYDQWAQSQKTSIKVDETKSDKEASNLVDPAQEQWERINQEFSQERTDQVVVPPEKEPIIDFSGTETFSKVLQSAVNIQQQSFQQR